MKKITIIILNIFFIFFILLIGEFYCAYSEFSSLNNHHQPPEPKNDFSFSKYIFDRYNIKAYCNNYNMRKPSGLQYLNKKPAIILMGCSYTYGIHLKDNETFSYQLSTYTKRPVYNYGVPAGSPREMLYLLRTNKIFDIYNIDKNKVNYIIYTYIGDHQPRLYANLPPAAPKYEKTKDDKLVYKNMHLYDKYFITAYIKRLKFYKYDIKNSFKLFTVYIKEINKEICNKFSFNTPPPKFVILVYSYLDNENWDLLKDEKNIQVIKVEDLIGRKIMHNPEFLTFDNDHPNAKAWEVIVPALAKELNL